MKEQLEAGARGRTPGRRRAANCSFPCSLPRYWTWITEGKSRAVQQWRYRERGRKKLRRCNWQKWPRQLNFPSRKKLLVIIYIINVSADFSILKEYNGMYTNVALSSASSMGMSVYDVENNRLNVMVYQTATRWRIRFELKIKLIDYSELALKQRL